MKSINYIKEKTWDIVSDRRISTLHPLVIGKAKELIIRAEKELGIKLRVTSALRTWAEQTNLYAKGRTTPGKKVTNAKAGSSYHNFGLAIDVVEIKNGKALWRNPNWNKIAELGKSIGFEWGGDWKSFKDKPHFQLTFGKSLAVLRELYRSGKRAGDYVNIA
jgi:peptidoglycan L-alanyl-D-glutamate endopeptidase CwlK